MLGVGYKPVIGYVIGLNPDARYTECSSYQIRVSH